MRITPPPQNLTAVNIDAVMDFYGTYVLLMKQVTLQNQDPVLNEAAQRLGVSLRQTEDELMRNMLQSTASFINCVGGTDGDNPTEITRSDVDFVVRTLRGNNAYSFLTGIEGEDRFGTAPVRDAELKSGHTDMIGQLVSSKWIYTEVELPKSAIHLGCRMGNSCKRAISAIVYRQHNSKCFTAWS